MISFDLETELIRPGRAAPRPVLAQSAGFDLPGPDALVRGGALLCKPGGETFRGLACEFVREGGAGANLSFDLGVLVEHGHATVEQVFDGFDRGVYHSVDVRQKLLEIAEGRYYWRKYNLGDLAERYGVGGVDKASPWRLRFAELEHVPWDRWPAEAVEYPLVDVTAPLTIFEGQERERARVWSAVGADPLADEARASRALWALWLVSAHGIVPDREALEYYRAWVEHRQREARKVLLAAGLLRLHGGQYKKRAKEMRAIVERAWLARAWPGRWDSLGAWLQHRGESVDSFRGRTGLDAYTLKQVWDEVPKTGLDAYKAKIVSDATDGQFVPYPRTDSGMFPSLDESTADALDLPELRAWLEYGSANSASDRYTELVVQTPIHTRFDLAESGRSRSSKPNTQNRNRKGPDRECFAPAQRTHVPLFGQEPARGLVYLVTDHDQLELSTVAQVLITLECGNTLALAINAGIDGHLALASDILEIPYSDAVSRYRSGDKAMKHWRTVAKAGNFGFAGGLGVPGFVAYALDIYGVRITLEVSRRVHAAWFTKWPEFKKYLGLMKIATRRSLATIQQVYSNRLRGGVGYCDAANTLFQGLGGDLTADVLYELQRDTRATPRDPRAVLEVWGAHRDGLGHELAANPGERDRVLAQWSRHAIEGVACRLGWHPRQVTNALLHGARVENYVHDEYLLAVHYRPRREGCLVVDPLLEARALAKEYVVRTVAERWLPDLRPTATANACARWSKAARDVRDERGRPVVWEVCDEVDEVALALGDEKRGAKAGPWARRVCEAARPWSDDARYRRALDARLTGMVPGYRRAPRVEDALAAVRETADVLDLTPF